MKPIHQLIITIVIVVSMAALSVGALIAGDRGAQRALLCKQASIEALSLDHHRVDAPSADDYRRLCKGRLS